MTLQRSILTSVLIHALVFASAFAFARFGAGELWSREYAVQVTLVSGGPERGAGRIQDAARKAEPPATPAASDVPFEHNKISPREIAQEPGLQAEHTAKAAPVESGRGNSAADAGTEGAERGKPGFGLISPEEWAMIEAAIERSKNYPRLARERAIQGTVRLRFKVDPSGSVQKVEVLKSSGFEILDDASVKSIYRATPMPYVKGWVEVPIAYVLK
ncbi:MAG TPA: energy transducer TonB [Nitrospirota bacterium]|nr:energy transducer TonB [Nitrospirota bacterium]